MTQVNFQIPSSIMALHQVGRAPLQREIQHVDQLNFNLHTPAAYSNLETKFQKPRPIVIEKLVVPAACMERAVMDCRNSSGCPGTPTNLSSERLSLAIQLAKMDMRRLKQISSAVENSGEEMLARPSVLTQRGNSATKNEILVLDNRRKEEKKIPVSKSVSQKSSKGMNDKSLSEKTAQSKAKVEINDRGSNEIKLLRKELLAYMKRLEELVAGDSGKSYGKQNNAGRIDDDELLRLNTRAEEQASRSARMLYVLQRKVQEIQDELDRHSGTAKPTKKSHAVNRLAAAHRSAVRALQMFVKHAPLYFNTHKSLPHSYVELTKLIGQLSLLSSQLKIEDDLASMDMDLMLKLESALPGKQGTRKTFESHNMGRTGKRTTSNPPNRPFQTGRKVPYTRDKIQLDRYKDWFRHRAEDLNLMGSELEVETPERQRALRAGNDALRRLQENSAVVKERPLIKRASRRKVDKPPAAISKKHFADATVSSVLKAQDIIPYKPKRAIGMEVALNNCGIPERPINSPRRRDAQLLSNKLAKELLQDKRAGEDLQKKIRRQAWPGEDQEGEVRHSKEDRLQELQRERNIYHGSMQTLDHTERVIKSKLQPLLEKAEKLANEERQREEDYKNSVRKRLAQIASNTVLSQAEILSELILDDLLLDTADELQCLEEEEELDSDLAMQKTGAGVDLILERLNTYEREENAIRRRWRKLQYIDLNHDVFPDTRYHADTKDLVADSRFSHATSASKFRPHRDTSIPLETTTSIFRGLHQFELFSRNHKLGGLSSSQFEKICEHFLDGILRDVAVEVETIWDSYVEDIYEHEFVKDISQHSDK